MAFFEAPLSRQESDAGVDRIEALMRERGWGLWAVEVPGIAPFIGFVGLAVPQDMPFSPCVEVGWRLAKEHWGKGYATEGASEALRFAFAELRLPEVVSFTAVGHSRSRAVMERIGMQLDREFEHPRVPEGHSLRTHVLYRVAAKEWSEWAKEASADSV